MAIDSRLLFPVLAAFLASSAVGADDSQLPPSIGKKIDFDKEVRPIFAETCYGCHGPKKQLSSFRLDRKADALKGGELGTAIVPGKSAESRLIRFVAGLDKEVKMPPKGDLLSPEKVAVLKAWIDQGAEWPESANDPADPRNHWAFKSPVKPAVPKASNPKWVRNPIDAFILERLDKEKWKPSVAADRTTLLRRAHLDLTGLPPTIAEVDAFLADQSSDAFEKAVERLLKSPHYGERWARHWLDAARYADSDGYEKDMSRDVWFYRDWVVKAFNNDMPYDRFVTEQLAGDQLPGATQDQIVATGFLRHSMLNEEGGIDPEQFRMDAMFDRMDALGKAVLGLTINCCQCHNHKYDPMSQEEYYRLFAFLNNDHEAQRVVYSPEESIKIAAIRREIGKIEIRMRSMPDWQIRLGKWEAERKAGPAWSVIKIVNVGDNEVRYLPQKDGSVLAQGYAPTKFTTHMRGPTDLKTIAAFRLELLNDPNLPSNGPGRSFMGTSALTEFNVEIVDTADPKKKTSVKFVKAMADYGNPERELEPNFDDKSKKKRVTGPIEFAIDGKDDTAWGIDAGPGRRNSPRTAIFVPEKPLTLPSGRLLNINLKQAHGGWNSDDHMNNNLGRFRVSVTPDAVSEADVLPKPVADAMAIPAERRTAEQAAAVFAHWRKTVPEWKADNAIIEAALNMWPAGTTSLTLVARDDMRDTRILKRGDFLKPTKPVEPGVPSFLHPLPDKADGSRLTLARWLTDRKSPTTARVFVNRVWQAYFGTGLVATSEDFGTQSDKPSHPELLDWLACDFMDRGWSIKELHRLIVTSSAYRQSSVVTAELLDKDPVNRLFARAPRLRVEGEIVRDIALQASGLLNPKVGGPSLFTPAPAFLFSPPASYGPFNWTDVQGAERYRRALYTFRRRSTPYPVFTNFDVPNADSSCVRRPRSNTPLQALTTLNEQIFLDCARALAIRTLKEGGTTDDERLTFAFRCCTSRAPTAEEKAELVKLMTAQKQRIADGWVVAAEVATGEKELKIKLPEGTTPTQLACYTVVSRVLLNLDETITKE